MKDIAIVFMVAGMSSRFGGKIKQFARVGPQGEMLIEYSMKQALSAGFTKIVFIVGNMTEKPFKEKFGKMYMGRQVLYGKQKFDVETRDKPWGTCDALCSVRGIVDCPFVVCNGDDLYGERTFRTLVEHLKKSKEGATIGYVLKDVLPEKGSTNRGMYKIDSKGYVQDINETLGIVKSELSSKGLHENDLCSMNLFALHPKDIEMLYEKLQDFIAKHKGDRKAECFLPTEIPALIKEGKLKMKIYRAVDKWHGITNPEDEEIVRKELIEESR